MLLRGVIATLALVSGLAGCADKKVPERKVLVASNDDSDAVIVGVLPEEFSCDSVAPEEELKAIIGSFKTIESSFETPPGLPKPCNFLSLADPGSGGRHWSFDLDCRPQALEDGNALMVQYAPASGAQPVHVGSSGLDYRNSALLFIDDDAPCYGRVLGPTADGRKKLAQLVARHLTERTAPTSLRYQREQSDKKK